MEMKYCFENIIGSFLFDKDTKKLEAAKGKCKEKTLPEEMLEDVLTAFKDKKYFHDFYEKNIVLTKKSIKESVTEDQLIMQAISNINELDKLINILGKRLREWYSLYYPELSEKISSHEKFAELTLQEKKSKDSMGADLEKMHLDEIGLLAKEISELYKLRKSHEQYLEKVMKKFCPNLLELAGATIGAKLIELGKGLKHLALLPASTIQLLGAEKALFRHLKTGSKSPKYGVILQHSIIQKAKKDKKGKAARMLADKLSLCARLDFFKGEFKAKEYRKGLEEKL